MFSFFSIACQGKENTSDEVKTIVSGSKVITAKSVDDIIKTIPVYNNKAVIKETVHKVKKVVYKGTFSIHRDDWERLSTILHDNPNMRVVLDFSQCKMEADIDTQNEKKNPSWYLPYDLFYDVVSLLEIHFPEGLTAIGSRSFCSCDNLTAVYFPLNTTVHSIGYNSFCSNPSLSEIHLYHYDGELDESFRECGVKAPDAGENECGTVSIVEMPDHPVYIRDYGEGYYQYLFGKTIVEKVITPSKTFTLDEWVDWCRPMVPATGHVKEISATSELDAASGKYVAKNVANAKWTSWVEGSAGDGTGEKLSFTLAEPTTISYLCIKNGFGNLAYYWTNNRPKDVKFIFDDDEQNASTYTLDDTPFAQYLYIQKYDKLYSKITMEIQSVYQGTDSANDCAIDEIAVNAGIARREVYGAYYTTEEVDYHYDPETQRMLKGLYTMDVGADNVRITDDGIVLVRTRAWEDGSTYWTKPSGAFSGNLYHGFFPGTGGGHSYYKFCIFVNPNGEHYLFTWHEEYNGIFELNPQKLHVYAWQKGEWIVQTREHHSASLDEIFNTLSFIVKEQYGYKFSADIDDYGQVCICIYPGSGTVELPVSLDFDYDGEKGVFVPYKKTVLTELAFGTRESLSALGDWKPLYEKTQEYTSPIQIFSYPAAFNHNPDMIRYLSESGYSVENEYKTNNGRSESYRFTPLEAWQAGNNANAVRDVLVEAGASYSYQMIEKAFFAQDYAKLAEFVPLVKKEDRTQLLAPIADFYRDQVYFKNASAQKTIDYIQSVLLLLKDNGVVLSDTFYDDHVNANITLMNSAFIMITTGASDYYNPIPLFNLYLSLGLQLPEQIIDYGFKGGDTTSIQILAYEWKDLYFNEAEDYLEDYEKKERRASQKLISEIMQYLLSHGISINARSKDGENALFFFCSSPDDSDIAAIQYLINLGIDLNVTNKYGQTPLLYLLDNSGHKDATFALFDLFLEHKVDVLAKDKRGHDAFYYFFDHFDSDDERDIEYVTTLLNLGADPNMVVGDNTVLYNVIEPGMYDLCKLLLDKGADPNLLPTEYAEPALFAAVASMRHYYDEDWACEDLMRLIHLLIDAGADCSVVVGDDFLLGMLSPYYSIYDTEIGKELIDLFLEHGAADNLTEKMLKEADFSKQERAYILSKKRK